MSSPSKTESPSGAPQGTDTGNKSLANLLAEWEQGSGKEGGKDTPSAETGKKVDLAARLEALEREAADAAYKRDIGAVIATVRGDLKVDDFLVEAWTNKRAAEDPRLLDLWNKRHEHKREFSAAMEALRPEFQKIAEENGWIGKKEDGKSGLIAAVRMARESNSAATGLDDTDFSKLSNQEFELKKAEVFRLAKAGKLN